MPNKHKYGWIKKDQQISIEQIYKPINTLEQLPSGIDLRNICSPVRDQGQLGSCTAFAIGTGLREFLEIKGSSSPIPPPPNPTPTPAPNGCLSKFIPQWLMVKLKDRLSIDFTVLSPLFLYYQERVIEGTVGYDSGATVLDGVSVLKNIGVCSETDDPYDISKFTQKPNDIAMQDAGQFKINSYSAIRTLDDMKNCLAEGSGFALGFNVYESFESNVTASTGNMPMPLPGEQILGGHAVFVCGYQDDPSWAGGGYLIVKNSWGTGWGDPKHPGYFYMPYAFAASADVSDCWTASI